MLKPFLDRLFGEPGAKTLKRAQKDLLAIKALEPQLASQITTLDQVKAKTADWKARFAGLRWDVTEDKIKINALLEEIKFEAIALHRRACQLINGQKFPLADGREVVWNMVPFDVQILGALALHSGNIAEMRTGEGKTLVATIAAYLNALAGTPVHIVTVNPYLANRDAAEMGVIYGALGLTTGVILPQQSPATKQEMYRRDVVYATNNELAFDYLRDNMAPSMERQAQGPLAFAIVDEVDSILIDEARTPLIISAPDDEATDKYLTFKTIAKELHEGQDYKIDEKAKTALLSEKGIAHVEQILGIENIFASAHYNDIHHVENALKAYACYRKDVDYIVRGQDVMIVDEHTGRVLQGRRYSHGLHQALEAKENVEIQRESRTLASVTFQNFFRLYRKLAGMTGTAKTEEEEFQKIYGLDVVVVPTNRPMIRADKADLIFKNSAGKLSYVAGLIKKIHATGQPILVGTVSVEKSEMLSQLLTREGITHRVLNAKQDEHEAQIVADAGRKGAVTIATNMAGRGTDIKIDDEVKSLGGLMIIGTEKHETRRIDNQLRGRAGRQGDPGSSQFLVCPQDDIMRIFGGERLARIFAMVDGPENEPLFESKFLTRTITNVQKQVEGRNFDIRKHILEYDDALDQHRSIVYGRRRRILAALSGGEGAEKINEEFAKMFLGEAEKLVDSAYGTDEDSGIERLDLEKLSTIINEYAGRSVTTNADDGDTRDEAAAKVTAAFVAIVEATRQQAGDASFEEFRRMLYLQSIDELWTRHIDDMAQLRESVAFEGYAQKNPLIVYKERAFGMFEKLMTEVQYKVIRGLVTAQPNAKVERADIDLDKLVAEIEKDPAMAQQVRAMAAALPDGNPLFTNPAHAVANEPGIRVKTVSAKHRDFAKTDGIRVKGEDRSETYTGGTASENQSHEREDRGFREVPKVGRNDPCPCGSGKKYKQCHGK